MLMEEINVVQAFIAVFTRQQEMLGLISGGLGLKIDRSDTK